MNDIIPRVQMIYHRNETKPNKAVDGFLHVSSSGSLRSTLVLGRNKRKPHGLSKRQARKFRKVLNAQRANLPIADETATI